MLDVAGIVVVGDVDDFQAAEELDVVATEFEVERILDFQVEPGEDGKAAGFVALADVVPIGVDVGIGETGVGVENRNELEFVGQTEDAPKRTRFGASLASGPY